MDRTHAIVDRLNERWPDPSRVAYLAWLSSIGANCPVCGWIGDGEEYHEEYHGPSPYSCSEKARALEAGLDRISMVLGGSLRECRTCGGLFVRIFSGPPAADSLFDVAVWFRRVTPAEAIDLVRRSEWWINREDSQGPGD